jgi:hypothetical protein
MLLFRAIEQLTVPNRSSARRPRRGDHDQAGASCATSAATRTRADDDRPRKGRGDPQPDARRRRKRDPVPVSVLAYAGLRPEGRSAFDHLGADCAGCSSPVASRAAATTACSPSPRCSSIVGVGVIFVGFVTPCRRARRQRPRAVAVLVACDLTRVSGVSANAQGILRRSYARGQHDAGVVVFADAGQTSSSTT